MQSLIQFGWIFKAILKPPLCPSRRLHPVLFSRWNCQVWSCHNHKLLFWGESNTTRTEKQKDINITPAHNTISCFICLKNQATEIDAVFNLTLPFLFVILFEMIMIQRSEWLRHPSVVSDPKDGMKPNWHRCKVQLLQRYLLGSVFPKMHLCLIHHMSIKNANSCKGLLAFFIYKHQSFKKEKRKKKPKPQNSITPQHCVQTHSPGVV